jgi:exonuclease III
MPSVTSPIDGLQIGHANVYHLCNKLHDVSRLLSETPSLHLLGLSETRLNVHDDKQVAISNYNFFRKDAKRTGQTGMGIYVHNEILKFITRRPDLEPENVECMWIQFKRSEKDSPLLVGFVYRNPASQYSWYDDFVAMMDLVTTKHSKANYILLGDFNIDLLRPHSSWDSTLSLYGLKQ